MTCGGGGGVACAGLEAGGAFGDGDVIGVITAGGDAAVTGD